uniref:Flippase-like domain-containing protein n=1 Tax=Eiseniibacteriota bacterium TaxID=2212470 RepID=A0A832I2U7_UNCEI
MRNGRHGGPGVKRTAQFVVAIAISAVCVWISMKDVRLADVLDALGRANWGGFVALMVLTLFGFWVRAVRWRYFIAAPRPISTGSLFSATMIGFMANNVLPFRLGEFVRPWALARREGLSKTTLLATIVVERAVDMLTLLGILGLSLLVHPISEATEGGRMVRAGAGVLLLLCVALTVFVVVLESQPRLAHGVIGALTAFLPAGPRDRVARAVTHFLEGLGLFRDLPRLLWVFVLSFGMFAVYALALSVGMWSIGIEVPWYGGLVMLVVTAIGIMVPAAPGYVGTLNVACIAGLALFGVGKEVAAPFSWFYFASQWLPITAVGLFYLNREGLSLRTLGQAQESAA